MMLSSSVYVGLVVIRRVRVCTRQDTANIVRCLFRSLFQLHCEISLQNLFNDFIGYA